MPLEVVFGADFQRFSGKIERGDDFGAILGRIFAGSIFSSNFHSFRARLDRKNQAKPLYCHQKSRFRQSIGNPVRGSIFHRFWGYLGTLLAGNWSHGAIFAPKNKLQNDIENQSRFSWILEVSVRRGKPNQIARRPSRADTNYLICSLVAL